MSASKELPIVPFASAALWEEWLAANHAQPDGVWLKIAKKGTGIASITYDEALDGALCYGWIDGQKKSFDETFFLQKFTPRRPRSLWSQRNVEKIAMLTAAGRLQPPGLAEVEAAKADGRWAAAYGSTWEAVTPAEFLAALAENERAKATFETLSRTERYSIGWRLATVKRAETRQRQIATLLETLERGEKPR